MDDESCKTLEKVLKNSPPDIPWDDLSHLLDQVAKHYGGYFNPTPGGRIRLTLTFIPSDPSLPTQEDTLNIPYSDTVYEAKTKAVAEFLSWAGVTPCP